MQRQAFLYDGKAAKQKTGIRIGSPAFYFLYAPEKAAPETKLYSSAPAETIV